MARRNVLQKSSLSLTAGNYLDLINAIDALQGAEENFYKSRAEELSAYKGAVTVGKTQIEQEYDAQLGSKPWEYTDNFNASNNAEAEATTGGGPLGGGPPTPFLVLLPDVGDDDRWDPDSTSGVLDPKQYVLYTPGAGEEQVDVFYQDIDWFKDSGPGEDGGFGEVPIKYQDNSALTGWMAHMYRLVGSLYDDKVKPKWNKYKDERDEYNNSVGGGGGGGNFFSGNGNEPWKGYQGSANLSYNRPKDLSTKLVKEAMGAND